MTAPTEDTATRIMRALIAAGEKFRKDNHGQAFTIQPASAALRELLAVEFPPVPAKKPKAPPKPRVSAMTDDGFLAFLHTDPAFTGVNVDAELKFARAWISQRKERKYTRAFVVKWITKAARDALQNAPAPVTSAAGSAPWRRECPGWRELLADYPVRDPKDPRYCDDWAKLSDDGKQWAWKIKRDGHL